MGILNKLIVAIVIPIFLGECFYWFFLRSEVHYGDFERVYHPNYSRIQGEVVEKTEKYTKQNEYFDCGGVKCHGWLYLPTDNDPKINNDIMMIYAHGFGAQKDQGPENAGRNYASEGFPTLIFDYRHFGGSDGVPRNLVSSTQQIEDVHSAISHIRIKYPKYKIALSGSSFGGGHVLVVANEYKEKHTNEGDEEALIGIVTLVSHLKGSSSFSQVVNERGILYIGKVLFVGFLDYLFSLIGCGPIMIPTYVDDNSKFGIMSLSREDYDGFFDKHPDQLLGGWQNIMPARISLTVSGYNPIDHLENIQYPVYFITAGNDQTVSNEHIEEAYSLVKKNQPKSQYYVFEKVNHFEFFLPESTKFVTLKSIEFLNSLNE